MDTNQSVVIGANLCDDPIDLRPSEFVVGSFKGSRRLVFADQKGFVAWSSHFRDSAHHDLTRNIQREKLTRHRRFLLAFDLHRR